MNASTLPASATTPLMRVLKAWPPNIGEITARFRISDRTIFAWGDVLFVPNGEPVPADVMAHEIVHRSQQLATAGGPAAWWERYLVDSAFVLEQEIPAYRRQYQVFCSLHRNKGMRVRHLAELASNLSGPLYGRLLDNRRALALIRGGKA